MLLKIGLMVNQSFTDGQIILVKMNQVNRTSLIEKKILLLIIQGYIWLMLCNEFSLGRAKFYFFSSTEMNHVLNIVVFGLLGCSFIFYFFPRNVFRFVNLLMSGSEDYSVVYSEGEYVNGEWKKFRTPTISLNVGYRSRKIINNTMDGRWFEFRLLENGQVELIGLEKLLTYKEDNSSITDLSNNDLDDVGFFEFQQKVSEQSLSHSEKKELLNVLNQYIRNYQK